MATQKAQILLAHCLTNLWLQAIRLLTLYSVPATEKWVVPLIKSKHHKVHGSIRPSRGSMLMFYISVTFWTMPSCLMSHVVYPHDTYMTTLIRMFFNL